jgi:CRISPR-associated protein (TIGR03986 family)
MVRKGDEWFVQPACTIEGASFCRVSRDYLDGKYLDIHQKKRRNNTKQNRRIFVRPSPADYHAVKNGVSIWMAWSTQTSVEPRDGSYVECQIAPSNHINGKTSEAVIYPPDSTKALLPLKYKKTDRYGEIADVDVAADYQMQLTDGQIEKLGAQGVLQYDHPVFYTVDRDRDGNLVVDAIGHTMMMRLLYQWSPYDLLPPDFRSEESVDMAEGVFGYVRTAKQKNTDLLPAYSSRVTFTPGILQSSAESAMDSQPVIPYILSSPKPTTFQHYLAQSDPDDAQRHAHYDSSDATLRGHKLYWHKGAVRSEQIFDEAMKAPGKDLTSQHTLVKMVRPNVRFTFRVYFENLSNLELGALQYVLSIPASSGPYRYKLGMAKPLGAGAVSIDSHIHLMDRDARYQRLMEVDTDGTGSWLTGTVDEVTCQERAQKARVRFESVMLSRQTDAKAIDRLPRMQQLLHLLNFEKSSVADRGYMELPRFRERPVLPRPEKVK